MRPDSLKINAGQLPFIAFIPKCEKDELLYSLLGRIGSLNALGCPRDYLWSLLGSRNAIPGIDIPNRLQELQDRLGKSSPFETVQQIIDQCTMYPYHRPFLEESCHLKAQKIIVENDGKGLKLLLGRIANGFGANPPLRYCSECSKDDYRLLGMTYWRRCHQLPGVTCCQKHYTNLVSTGRIDRVSHRHCLILPPNISDAVVDDSKADKNQCKFCALSCDLLASNLLPIPVLDRINAYRDAARKIGFSNRNRTIDRFSLAEAIRQHYADFDGFSCKIRLLSSKNTPLSWVHTAILRPETAIHPICHLLLIGFLFGSIKNFLDSLNLKSPLTERYISEEYIVSNQQSSQNHCLFEKKILLDAKITCRAAAELLNLSTTTVVSRRQALGVAVSERRKFLTENIINETKLRLSKGLSPSSIASDLALSLSTVYRIRSQLPHVKCGASRLYFQESLIKKRQDWLNAIEAHGSKGVKGIRRSAPAVYSWLYRNDRTWLREKNQTIHKPAIKQARVNWDARDAEMCTQLEQFVATLKNSNDRPRLSYSMLARHVGSAQVKVNLLLLPKLNVALLLHSESTLSYQLYRIDKAIEHFSKLGNLPACWRIMRHASIRNWTSDLLNYATNAVTLAEANLMEKFN